MNPEIVIPIIKLYENAGVNKIGIKRCSGIKQSICQHNCNECESFDYKYPSFTAEKQLELENFLLEDSGDRTFTQFEILKTIENKFLYVYRFQKTIQI